jgi:DegV family protein with EDD domain
MSKVALVTDSTAYIPQALIDQYQIQVAPQILIWGQETLKDGVDIMPNEFYTRLKNAKVMPTTSQVTPSTFHQIFSKLLEQGQEVLAILISERISGTLTSAFQAQDMIPDAPIAVVDSQTSAMAMGFQVLTVAKAAAEGASLAECKDLAEALRSKTGVVFTVETLEFLHRGGRIGGASRFLGTALNFKPILELSKGRVEAVERVRTRRKSIDRLIELVEERINGRSPVRLASINANAPEEAAQLLEAAVKRFNAIETISAQVSPVIGTHTGPGTVGLAFMAGV